MYHHACVHHHVSVHINVFYMHTGFLRPFLPSAIFCLEELFLFAVVFVHVRHVSFAVSLLIYRFLVKVSHAKCQHIFGFSPYLHVCACMALFITFARTLSSGETHSVAENWDDY